jgi:phosphatidylserine/phosphatidylglycerophosphate/cardiolipin synthase-like enzyme
MIAPSATLSGEQCCQEFLLIWKFFLSFSCQRIVIEWKSFTPDSTEDRMKNWQRIFFFVLFVALLAPFSARALEVLPCFSPNGGFAAVNNERKITIEGAEQPLGLNNALLDLILRTPASGSVKIAAYNFSHKIIFQALLDRALKDGIQVKIILDNCADWTKESVKDFATTVDKVARRAAEDKRPFDFQIRLVTPAIMKQHKRTRILDDGKEIIGTMHQKFGVIYEDRTKPPVTSFSGSSNICPSSDEVYAENRIFFRNSTETAAIWASQFARLWNEYAEPATQGTEPEPAVTLDKKPDFEILFNIEPVALGKFRQIDERVMGLLDELTPDGSVDVAMFSFTHMAIAQKILAVAEKNPGAVIRLFFDHSMLLSGPDRRGLMPPFIEEQIKAKNLKNIEVRYKFRANSYAYDPKTKEVAQDHFRAPLLHHKFLIVNKKKIITGSYNWSASAELRNMEDAMIFDAATPYGKDVIDRYLAEFNHLWDKQYEAKHAGTDIKPFSISRAYAMEYEKKIKETLADYLPSRIQKVLDDGPLPAANLRNLVKVGGGELNKALEKLKAAFLIETFTKDGVERWRLAD